MDIVGMQNELIAGARHRLRRIEELVSLADEQRMLILGRRHAEFQSSMERQETLLVDLSGMESREQSLITELVQADRHTDASAVFRNRYRELNSRIRDEAARLESRLAANSIALGTMIECTETSICTVSMLLGEQPRRLAATVYAAI